jgi:cell wall assembly regulator SMI1
VAQDRRVNSKNFFGELKRRNVYKVAVAYIVAGWALAQGLAQVLPVFSVATWTHPCWNPLRGDPRFEQIIASLAPASLR